MGRDANGRQGGLRERIAHLAARIMAEDGVDDFAYAKRKAARQAGARDARAMPDNKEISVEMKKKMQAQLRMKLTPGVQEGEIEGSLHDAMMQLMPDMKMDPEGMKPGNTPQKMVDAMLNGWRKKYGNLPDVEPISMETDPTPPALNSRVTRRSETALNEALATTGKLTR